MGGGLSMDERASAAASGERRSSFYKIER